MSDSTPHSETSCADKDPIAKPSDTMATASREWKLALEMMQIFPEVRQEYGQTSSGVDKLIGMIKTVEKANNYVNNSTS